VALWYWTSGNLNDHHSTLDLLGLFGDRFEFAKWTTCDAHVSENAVFLSNKISRCPKLHDLKSQEGQYEGYSRWKGQTCPLSNTRSWSYSATVRSRWATNSEIMTVDQNITRNSEKWDTLVMRREFVNSWRIVVWIFASVEKSMLLVASSRIMMELRRRRARASAISCLWPCEKFDPPGDTLLSRVIWVFVSTSVGATDTDSVVSSRSMEEDSRSWVFSVSVIRWTRRRTSKHSASVCSPVPSRSLGWFRYDEVLYRPNGSRFSLIVPENKVAS